MELLDSLVVPVRQQKSQPQRSIGHRRTFSGSRLGSWLVVFVVGGNDGFEVFGFEHLVAIQASHIVHTVTSGQYFRTGVIAGLHRKRDYPHSKHVESVVKPPKVPVQHLFAAFFHPLGQGCLQKHGPAERSWRDSATTLLFLVCNIQMLECFVSDGFRQHARRTV
jgi:hypothetical protein